MKRLILATLACILAIPLVTTTAPAVSKPAVTPVVATATTPLPGNPDKIMKILYAQLLKLRKEVSILESKMKREHAKGHNPEYRRNAGRLARLKKVIALLETRIKQLKIRHQAKVRAKAPGKGKPSCKCERKSRVEYSCKCKKIVRAKASCTCKCTKRVVGKPPSRKPVAWSGLKDASRYHTGALQKVKEHLGRLLKEKASLELRLKKTCAEILKARRALAGLMRDQAQKVRKSRMVARKRIGAHYRKAPRRPTGIARLRAAHKQAEVARRTATMKKAAALRKRAALRTHRHPVRLPRLSRKSTNAPRMQMQGEAVQKELRLLRHEVARIRMLLESALKAHKKAAPAKVKKRKGVRKDYRTL